MSYPLFQTKIRAARPWRDVVAAGRPAILETRTFSPPFEPDIDLESEEGLGQKKCC